MNKELIKQILVDQRNNVFVKKNQIIRDRYTDVIDKLHLPHVQVLTGLRRSGKSTLMKQIIQDHFGKGDFFYINFEDERFIDFPVQQFYLLHESLIELYGDQAIFFIDEVQNIPGFETFIRRLTDEGKKFVITGSNANLLSSEIATKLTGRHINTFISPFTFNEFLRYKKVVLTPTSFYDTTSKLKIVKLFDEYLVHGGMPEYTLFREPEIITRTYEDIVLKDIVVRYKIENNISLRELYRFIVSNVGQLFSYNSLTKTSMYASTISVQNYVSYLENTYFIKTISKYDYSVKKKHISEKKAYVIDNGFIRYISMKFSPNNGWLLENLVFNTLNQQGNVFYYKNKKECDFILEINNQLTEAVQVCFSLNEENKVRECEGLLAAMQEFSIPKGYIITNSQEETIEYKGQQIELVPAWKWILR